MAAEDNPQPIRGIVQDGDAKAADQFHPPVIPGLDSGNLHKHLRVRDEGEADSGDNLTALTGKDSAGNLHFLKTTTDGEQIINLGAEKSDFVEGSATALAAVAPSFVEVVAETTVADTKYLSVEVSGVGLVEVEVRAGTVAAELLVVRKHLTSSNPDRTITFPAPILVVSGDKILVQAKNVEPGGPSANKDVLVHGTLFKEA